MRFLDHGRTNSVMPPILSSAPPSPDVLRRMAVAQRCHGAGSATVAIIELAARLIRPRHIWLFGSRARGDGRPLSDIDLAFEGGDPTHFGELSAWVEEEAPTLLDVDLVDLDTCNAALRASVSADGILLYERP